MHQSQRTAWWILTYVYNHVTIRQIKISKVLSNFSTFPPPTPPVATTRVFSVTMSLFLFCLFVCFVFWSHIGVKSYGLWLTLVSTIPKYIEIQVWSGGGANRRVVLVTAVWVRGDGGDQAHTLWCNWKMLGALSSFGLLAKCGWKKLWDKKLLAIYTAVTSTEGNAFFGYSHRN